MLFAKLDDSPMFRQQLQCLEDGADSLRTRCWKFYKECRKYTDGLGEVYDRDIAFANALENFRGGHSDPHFVALGGPVMTKYTIALREISTYKELLRSQVEHMLNERLLHIINVDVHEVKEARKRFDKASLVYDQAREKFMSLKKSTKIDVATVIEEELQNARTSFEETRFILVSALNNIEAKKKFEFLEAVTGIMDAHLRYFQQGYQLLHQMEPFLSEVLDYVQQSRESYSKEEVSLYRRMEEYKRHVYEESRLSLNGPYGSSPSGDSAHPFSRISNDVVDVVMESAANGKVQIIRQGYLSKRSSNLRGDWKRRYFVLDSRGTLYYYRKPWNGSYGSNQPSAHKNSANENGSGLLSRWLSSHYHGGVHDERSVARHTVNLLTSTIKVDADQTDLRFCFRIISPAKNYTLQAENAVDQMDWMEKINGVIASLLSVQTLGTVRSLTLDVKVWDLSVLTMFKSLGNLFANSVWEELLHSTDDMPDGSSKANSDMLLHARKPKHDDSISLKERFIHAKYSEKIFVCRTKKNDPPLPLAQQVRESIYANDKKAIYRHIVKSDIDVNAIGGKALSGESFNMAFSSNSDISSHSENQLIEDIQDGSTVLHLACETADIGMVELLLQYGADINACDSKGRTPLHCCIIRGNSAAAKVLIMRGGNPHVADKEGNTPLNLASETSSVANEMVVLLTSK
ncbi:PREDICTED: ADP-ribosylation factor GTPase-activating protein AGD1-like isoform X3 [Lupinus angustifolius]|uniref:ADP-ribosylation factor GTPase-activating protein AGD1-like isoform X3 n=1 Tax=Lupinus angustifolius TaxID=3871 RepID=UPI00092FD264|nr:PREDICTED: ADP-ribosylation factor GTPase-activating protein AGD1-like isoform X3 [Lupinus angustifolius]